MAANVNVDEMHTAMSTALAGLSKIYEKVVEDHKEANICSGYTDYMGETPKAFLDRARAKLEKKKYKIGFAGGFSGGKSTLVNALLNEPDLLAAEAGECTMSITVISSPKSGGDEHVEDPSPFAYKKRYEVNEINLLAFGDILLLHSDGLSDHGSGEYFPLRLESLMAELRHEHASTICRRVREDILAFAEPEDDISVVVIRRSG